MPNDDGSANGTPTEAQGGKEGDGGNWGGLCNAIYVHSDGESYTCLDEYGHEGPCVYLGEDVAPFNPLPEEEAVGV